MIQSFDLYAGNICLKKMFSFLGNFFCILFPWRFSPPFPSGEKAKDKFSWSNQGKWFHAFPLKWI